MTAAEKFRVKRKRDLIYDFVQEHAEASISLGLIARLCDADEWMQLKARFSELASPLLHQEFIKGD
jgi:hypothetical protein